MNARMKTVTEIDFDEILRDSILKSMNLVLGSAGSQAMAYHIGAEALTDPETFHAGLTKIFGTGSDSLEFVILKHLSLRTGGNQDSLRQGEFTRQVNLLKRNHQAMKGRRESGSQ